MKKKHIEWSKYDHLLGYTSDKDLATLTGCTESNVRFRRKKFSIPPAIHAGWSDEDCNLLLGGQAKCLTCLLPKPLAEFHAEEGRRTGTKRVCKGCVNSARRIKRLNSKQKLLALLGGKCQNCGFDSLITPLQFHHIFSDTKEHTISRIICSDSRQDEVLSELNKCCILCSNCHDSFHANELQLKFTKRANMGWTVDSSEVALASKFAATEDSSFLSMSV